MLGMGDVGTLVALLKGCGLVAGFNWVYMLSMEYGCIVYCWPR